MVKNVFPDTQSGSGRARNYILIFPAPPDVWSEEWQNGFTYSEVGVAAPGNKVTYAEAVVTPGYVCSSFREPALCLLKTDYLYSQKKWIL